MTQHYLVLSDIKNPNSIKTIKETPFGNMGIDTNEHEIYAKQNQIISINDDNEIVITSKERLFPTWSGGCGNEPTTVMGSFTYNHSGLPASRINLNDLKMELKSKTKSKSEQRAESLKQAKDNIQKDKQTLEQKEEAAIMLETILKAIEDTKLTQDITHEVLTFPMFNKMLKTLSKQLNIGIDTAWSEIIPQVKVKE
jgi:hypothetical protein